MRTMLTQILFYLFIIPETAFASYYSDATSPVGPVPPIVHIIILLAVFYGGYHNGGGVSMGLKYIWYFFCAIILFCIAMTGLVLIAAYPWILFIAFVGMYLYCKK